MELIIAGGLSRSFRKGSNEEAYRRFLWQRQEQQERERRQKEARFDEAESDLIDFASAVISNEQAELFQTEIQTYQIATVEALEANREATEFVRERLERILRQAHRLDDGRRVFKTEDGLRVFDEFGVELSSDIISPDEIPDHAPRWETAKGILDDLERLKTEREELLDYQADLDKAQELLDSGKMTQAQFDELRERLAETAPACVKARLRDVGMDKEVVEVSATSAETDIDLDAELSSMLAPKPFMPGRN